MDTIKNGALIDPRPIKEKEGDFLFDEMVTSVNPVDWIEKPKDEWRRFPIFNQDNSGSCVAQTLAKLLGILYYLKNQTYVHFSATHIYQRRSNKPAGGMAGVEAFQIAREGVTLEALVPSQNMNDEAMDSAQIEQYKKDVGSIFKLDNYVQIKSQDIATIASIIQTTKKGVMVWYYFQRDEWTDLPTIKNDKLTLREANRHSVTAVDFTIYNGKLALIIEDSWGKTYGLNGQRIITEDFHKERNWFSAYPIKFVFEEKDETTEKPEYNFTKPLRFSPIFSMDSEVGVLQDILKYEGLFPKNIESTGYYGSITVKAVLAFQRKYNVASEAELVRLEGKLVGPKTRMKLNELYGK